MLPLESPVYSQDLQGPSEPDRSQVTQGRKSYTRYWGTVTLSVALYQASRDHTGRQPVTFRERF